MTTNRPGRPRYDDLLTPTEWQVAELIRHGMSNPRIAAHMGVSVDGVKFHVGNVLSKLGFAGRDQLRLWDGVAKASALNHRRFGMVAISNNDSQMTLGQVARTVESAEKSRVWFRDILGLPELYSFGNLAFFDLGGVRLMLTEEDGGTGPSDSILYLRVADIHAAKNELEARGVKFTNAPHVIHRHTDGTEEWVGFFEDDQGRMLALMAQVRSDPGQSNPTA